MFVTPWCSRGGVGWSLLPSLSAKIPSYTVFSFIYTLVGINRSWPAPYLTSSSWMSRRPIWTVKTVLSSSILSKAMTWWHLTCLPWCSCRIFSCPLGWQRTLLTQQCWLSTWDHLEVGSSGSLNPFCVKINENAGCLHFGFVWYCLCIVSKQQQDYIFVYYMVMTTSFYDVIQHSFTEEPVRLFLVLVNCFLVPVF